jgi:hypothetical protein
MTGGGVQLRVRRAGQVENGGVKLVEGEEMNAQRAARLGQPATQVLGLARRCGDDQRRLPGGRGGAHPVDGPGALGGRSGGRPELN